MPCCWAWEPAGHRAPGRWRRGPCGTHRPRRVRCPRRRPRTLTGTGTRTSVPIPTRCPRAPRPRRRPARPGATPASCSARPAAIRCPTAAQLLRITGGQGGHYRFGIVSRAALIPDPPQPVDLAEHLWRRQTAVGEGQHPVKGVARQHRGQLLAAAGAQRGAAVQRERHVAAQLGPQRMQIAPRGTPSSHRAFIATSTAAASALPPAIPPATGMHFSTEIATSGARPTCSAMSSAACHARLRASAGASQSLPSPVSSSDRTSASRTVISSNSETAWNTVVESVIAVVAQVSDGEIQIDLPRRTDRDRPSGHPLSSGVPVHRHRTRLSPAGQLADACRGG